MTDSNFNTTDGTTPVPGTDITDTNQPGLVQEDMTSRQRKNIKKERTKISQQGIKMKKISGHKDNMIILKTI